jgi:nicotinate-nucleotide pyrophosphorylase (carboxylating)
MRTGMDRTRSTIEDKVWGFLREDLGYGDITSEALIDEGQMAKASLYFREEGIVAGLDEAATIFSLLGCKVKILKVEGTNASAGEALMEVEGSAKALLAGERTALNIVGRMAGIATTVENLSSKVAGVNPGATVAATRKTAPGLRDMDKQAVDLGGGDTHRFRLDDCVLIKDNHLSLLPSITEAVRRARSRVSFTKKIEVEVGTLEEAEEAARAGSDIVMFDNMPPLEIERCLSVLGEKGLREGRIFEASGNITPENVVEYAEAGVDIISMGCLTHSVRSLNVKLEIEML